MSRDRTREKFTELAESRVGKCIKSIRLVGNLANKSNYKYTEDDAKKIIKALEQELKEIKAKFTASSSKNSINFKL